MELRHIRYFLAIAAEGNFTRAAEQLGIGQPPLSQQIRNLEQEVGAKLFHRVAHGAELTEAGQAFHAQVRQMPEMARLAIEAARRADRGETGTLALGYTGAIALTDLLPKLIRRFRHDYPDVTLHLTEANSLQLRKDLLEQRIDIAILRPDPVEPPELNVWHLTSEPLIVALPRSMAPASDDLHLGDLHALPLIATPRSLGTSLHDAAVAACRAAGFEPVLAPPAPQIASILSLIAAEMGFSLLPASMARLQGENIAYKPVKGPQPIVELSIATPKGPLSPVTRAFLHLALRDDDS